MLKTVTKVPVTENYIDNLGHVNNTVYVAFLGTARKEWYREAGLSLEEKKRRNVGAVVRRLEINFIKESRLGDTLKIITRPFQLGNKSFLLKQDIYNQNDEHLTDAIVTAVMFDTLSRKSIKVIDEIAGYFKEVEN